MSILAEILSTADQVEIVDLNSNINKITQAISSLKMEVMETMENTYVKFLPLFEEDKELLRKSQSLTSELTDIHSRIEDQIKRELANSTGELHNLKDSLHIATTSLHYANELLEVHTLLKIAAEKQKSHNFHEAAMAINRLENRLMNSDEDLKNLDIHAALLDEIERVKTHFSYAALEQWWQCIAWIENVVELDKKKKQISLRIVNGNAKEDLVQALHYYDLLDDEVNKFGRKLLEVVLFGIINEKSEAVTESEDEASLDLLIRINKGQKPSLTEVLGNLTVVFEFLFTQLNVKIGEKENAFIKLLGILISEEFCKYFIKHCLEEAIPKRQEELDLYKAVINDLLHFEDLLHENCFLLRENGKISQYTENVDVLIADKICAYYLQNAKEIMRKDLHMVKEVGVSFKVLQESKDISVAKEIKTIQGENNECTMLTEFSPNTFQFPLCQISTSTEELLELVSKLLNETAKSTSDVCALKLFTTARNVFRLFIDIVPLCHSKMLETIPQQSALLHNNCYYLAHCLIKIEVDFKTNRPESLKECMVTFVDLVEPLQCMGSDVLQNQLNTQKRTLISILRDSGLVTLIENPEFPQGIEKAIRQCTQQLALLRSVWQRVLSTDIFCKSIGYLCSAVVEELVQRVCSADDIPADTSSELVEVFSIVQKKAPLLFPEPKEIYKHVKYWTKFDELVRLLGASLYEVDERWADGKGPLAQEFSPEQMKQLIKALFQISDRRSALIAKIS